MKKVLALAGLLLSATVFANDKVEVQNIQVVNIPGGSSIQGIAHNNTNATLKNIFVNFKLYDKQGNVVGNTLAHGQDIGPGENFKFAADTNKSFAEARLSGVDVY
ncbi:MULTISPECIES: FxLYD domain-containing protein [Pseudomonas]|nr:MULTISPECIES: FxLYD domain-containing protein [Pseudomonas]EPM91285.1 hypothetical protein A259_39096 [Pseudomonas syringae pv. actinidiae ICMP 19070]MCJ2373736.1 FxLYD domain-containing protein [Pseudomonas sp. RGM 3321]NVL36869.1 hypothetical protein [Pseudomonas syringae pv. actinidiae]